METDIRSFVVRVSKATTEELQTIKLELVDYLHDLGIRYASQLREFSESITRNKEEWYKKSMTECVHQAGREVGYAHEATKVEIEATKILLEVIGDTEQVIQGESVVTSGCPPQTDPSSTSEPSDSPEVES